ncbi:MAG: 50S ribosomal protein L7Ae [Candidatus Thermoplasmatota archaeon]|jgi:large subunit ribosomal protein L7Ae|nr:50S ribosomal protein L7Ae [Candidatus Thermoplasmatota archaeon]MCL5963095.1 50S ribosomal protein L7Ae [Candidatus Thermoplasmatota archaeon]
MAKESYIRFETPKEIGDKAYELVKVAGASGKLAKGTNEVTKMIERSEAKLVVIAEDVQPPEILEHIPMLCEEKNIPYVYVKNKQELGKSAGINKNASSVAVIIPGKGEPILNEIVAAVSSIKR